MIPRMSVECERTVLCPGKKFDFARVRFRDASGGTVEKEYVAHPGAVVVLPLLDANRLVLIRNFRAATGTWEWEFPAGTLDKPGEPASSCAARELVEETGYEAGRISFVGSFLTSPGLSDERMRAFVGEDLRAVGQRLEEGEQISVEIVPVSEVWRMVSDGRFRDGKSLSALLLATGRGFVPMSAGFPREAQGDGG